MKLLAAVIATTVLVSIGRANAGEIVIKPKTSDGAVVLTMSAGKVVDVATAGEIVIKPKSFDSAVVLTIGGGKLLKASISAVPKNTATWEPAKESVVSLSTP
jgi:hypothetical protein